MNIPALKAFAPTVRRQLIEAVTLKLNFVLTARTPDYLDTYARQVAALRTLEQEDRAGLIERVAYTWFNRFTALRFLDARGWHPFGIRVLTPATPDETQPEVLKLMRTGHCPEELQRHTSLERLNGLLDGRIPSSDPQGEVYRQLVLAACRFYHALLPDLFERLDDEIELLLPEDLLTKQSVVQGFRTGITDEDCTEVEILGWLYQFYISEKKDQVMARKAAVPTEDIPAVTQLFTPHWIVRYLVENSLGRLWILNHPRSKLREQMPYYIEGETETVSLHLTRPEEIKICDPAVGSGHMLTYAFDLLFAIYEEEGYAPNEIPALILRHNLHGLDICPRAAQLAEMALVFKAREKSNQFFQPVHLVRPYVMELREVRFSQNELHEYIDALGLGELFNEGVVRLMHQFEEAKSFGSLIQPCLDGQTIAFVRGNVEARDLGGQLFLHETHLKVLRVLEQAEALTQRYNVVVANPPYMGTKFYNASLKKFVAGLYNAGQPDTYGCFIERNILLAGQGGFVAMITIPNWMFISSFEDLREFVLGRAPISSLIYNGRGVWGPDFGSCAFTLSCGAGPEKIGIFRRLLKKLGEVNSNEELVRRFNDQAGFPEFQCSSSDFQRIPGKPLAFWITASEREKYSRGDTLENHADTRKGLDTGENDRFLRFWHEVDSRKCSFAIGTASPKWFPYNKGGEFRKWYGNREIVINWENSGREIKAGLSNLRKKPTLRNQDYYLRESATWSTVTISRFSARYSPEGSLFDNGGCSAFAKESRFPIALISGLLNSSVAYRYLEFLAPTVNYQPGDVGRILLPESLLPQREGICATAMECVAVARQDWDNSEISWEFRDFPFLRPTLREATVEASWRNWDAQCNAAIRRMRELETRNNRLFIDAYGLQEELSPDVPEEEITLARAHTRRDMAAFLSYAVGCMMGRYSLDRPGLILADAGESVSQYVTKVGRTQDQLTFSPDEDGIIPVLDGEWFEDDIVARTREFLRATFGEATLRENIRFIEYSLGRELRNYFLTDFYKDHLQTYKKRPIYWMIQSPKKGFSVLIYLHRYTRDTMNLVLNRYLREYQVKLRSRIAHLADAQVSSIASARDKAAARKEFDKLTKTLHECEEWERQVVLPLAQARIELDLDDGVKVNYLKLGEALAPIPGLAAAED